MDRLRGRRLRFLCGFFDVGSGGPGGEFAGVVFVNVADDAVEDSAGDHSALNGFADFCGRFEVVHPYFSKVGLKLEPSRYRSRFLRNWPLPELYNFCLCRRTFA